MVIFCFLNTIPLFIVSFLANLSVVSFYLINLSMCVLFCYVFPLQITSYVGFLQNWATRNSASFAIVSGILPATVSSLFGCFLPSVMRWLSKYIGVITHSKLDRAVVARYFAFLVISQLFIFTLIGVIFSEYLRCFNTSTF